MLENSEFGRYKVLRLLGEGGMASVYLASQQSIQGFSKRVALKVVHPVLVNRDEFNKFFINEARLGGFLAHPHIVQTLDFGEIDGQLFLAMELVDGTTLSELLDQLEERSERFPLDIALQIAIDICEGLDYAHSARDQEGRPLRIVHRDMKPSNVLLSRFGEVKIADFGVARAESNLNQTIAAGALKGTVRYMSPEQALGDSVDFHSDLFAVGIIVYEMVTMCYLYDAAKPERVLRQAQDAHVAPRLELLPESPVREDLKEFLTRALAREPADRFPSAGEMAELLGTLRKRLPDRTSLKTWFPALGLQSLDPAGPGVSPSSSRGTPSAGDGKAVSGVSGVRQSSGSEGGSAGGVVGAPARTGSETRLPDHPGASPVPGAVLAAVGKSVPAVPAPPAPTASPAVAGRSEVGLFDATIAPSAEIPPPPGIARANGSGAGPAAPIAGRVGVDPRDATAAYSEEMLAAIEASASSGGRAVAAPLLPLGAEPFNSEVSKPPAPGDQEIARDKPLPDRPAAGHDVMTATPAEAPSGSPALPAIEAPQPVDSPSPAANPGGPATAAPLPLAGPPHSADLTVLPQDVLPKAPPAALVGTIEPGDETTFVAPENMVGRPPPAVLTRAAQSSTPTTGPGDKRLETPPKRSSETADGTLIEALPIQPPSPPVSGPAVSEGAPDAEPPSPDEPVSLFGKSTSAVFKSIPLSSSHQELTKVRNLADDGKPARGAVTAPDSPPAPPGPAPAPVPSTASDKVASRPAGGSAPKKVGMAVGAVLAVVAGVVGVLRWESAPPPTAPRAAAPPIAAPIPQPDERPPIAPPPPTAAPLPAETVATPRAGEGKLPSPAEPVTTRPVPADRSMGKAGGQEGGGRHASGGGGGTGVLFAVSKPPSTVFLDGKLIRGFPVVDHRVPAGKHRIKFDFSAGMELDRMVEIPAGTTLRCQADYAQSEITCVQE